MAKADPLQYPKDVLLAYSFWKRDFPAELIIDYPSAEAIHEFGNVLVNRKEFLAMVKAATDQLQKNDKDKTPDELLKKERLAVADLKSRVAAAVEASRTVDQCN